MAKVIFGSYIEADDENFEGLLSTLKCSGFKDVYNKSKCTSAVEFSAQNLRFTEPEIKKPTCTIIPKNKLQLELSVAYSIRYGLEIRVRCGGHSQEGLSYTADNPFVLIDLKKLNKVKVDARSEVAWVEGGATLGEVYSAIANSSSELGFPAGSCHTVGVGGHIAGGGIGFLSRKYGLAADNVLDAELIDGSGCVKDRAQMGEDVFWALRGGGGGSWGVVYAWTIRLVKVPRTLTAFKVYKTGSDIVTDTVSKWQYVAPEMEDNIFMQVKMDVNERKVIRGMFHGIYLGRMKELLFKIAQTFPELEMTSADCEEMSWIKTIAYFENKIPVSELTNRYYYNKAYFKSKSDFVKTPIPDSVLTGLWARMEREPRATTTFSPLGGKMDRILSSATPFPYRKGNLFLIHYNIVWSDSSQDYYYLKWMKNLHKYMEPAVSSKPRGAYVNFIDLDLGTGNDSVEQATDWAEKYFGMNFLRLVKAKTQVDPNNYFRNPQSIPPSRDTISDKLTLLTRELESALKTI